jgi:predicted transcriptional regulator
MYGLCMIIYIYIYISFDKAKNPSNQLISIVLNISHYGKMNVMDEMYPIMD